MKPKKKARKPVNFSSIAYCHLRDEIRKRVRIVPYGYADPDNLRKLAAWLIKAADWLESK